MLSKSLATAARHNNSWCKNWCEQIRSSQKECQPLFVDVLLSFMINDSSPSTNRAESKGERAHRSEKFFCLLQITVTLRAKKQFFWLRNFFAQKHFKVDCQLMLWLLAGSYIEKLKGWMI